MPRAGTQIADLENTLTHELGHVQGLAHTCWDHITPTPPLDNTGMPIPDCNDPRPAGEHHRHDDVPVRARCRARRPSATLSPDDVSGVCDVYQPLAGKLGCYPEIDGGACSAAPAARRTGWPLWPAALGAVVTAVALDRRRRRCSRS